MVAALLACALAMPKSSVPSIAKIAGIVLGQTTVEQFEAAHGKAMPWDDHFFWYDATSGATISAQAWYRDKAGRIIDFLMIDWAQPGQGIFEYKTQDAPAAKMRTVRTPAIHLAPSDLGLLSLLRRGMTRHDVRAAMHMRLDDSDSLVAKGRLSYAWLTDGGPFHRKPGPLTLGRWAVDCCFTPVDPGPNKLTGLMARADSP